MPSTKEVVKCRFKLLGGAHALEVQDFPEAATQTFKRGDLLENSSGKCAVSVSAGSDWDSTPEYFGVATMDASGTTDTPITAVILNSATGWVLPMTHATPASAITAITDIGTLRTLERTAAGDVSVTETTTDPIVEIAAIHPQYPVGEQYGWVVVKAIRAEQAVTA